MAANKWDIIIRPYTSAFRIDLKEIFSYKDLIISLVQRFFTTMYKQTILGPAWLIVNPLLTTIIFTVFFGNVAQMSTDGVPKFLFYLAGNTIWLLFSGTFSYTNNTFQNNYALYSKVYFPRLCAPIANVIGAFINACIQFSLFAIVLACYGIFLPGTFSVQWAYLPFFFLLALIAMMCASGAGLLCSALAVKYRDITVISSFGLQLWMYATPVVYAWSSLGGKMKWLVMINPMAEIVEAFRFIFLGEGHFSLGYIALSFGVSAIIFFIGLFSFNKVEKTFVDTI